MTETSAYRCKISSENCQAWLTLGWRRYCIDIIELSRDSFTARVAKSLVGKLPSGGEGILHFQDTAFRVQFADRWIDGAGQLEVDLVQLEELRKPKVKKTPWWVRANAKSVNGPRDPMVVTAVMTAAIVTILILPSCGGKWGTSDAICSAVATVWNSVSELFIRR